MASGSGEHVCASRTLANARPGPSTGPFARPTASSTTASLPPVTTRTLFTTTSAPVPPAKAGSTSRYRSMPPSTGCGPIRPGSPPTTSTSTPRRAHLLRAVRHGGGRTRARRRNARGGNHRGPHGCGVIDRFTAREGRGHTYPADPRTTRFVLLRGWRVRTRPPPLPSAAPPLRRQSAPAAGAPAP